MSGISYAIFDATIFVDKYFIDDRIFDDTILIALVPRYPSAAHSLLAQVFHNILKEEDI